MGGWGGSFTMDGFGISLQKGGVELLVLGFRSAAVEPML